MVFNELPETGIVSKDCTNPNYLFNGLATQAYERMVAVIQSFTDDTKAYTGNVIGIIGSRGSGKTSLLESMVATLKENHYYVPQVDEEFRVYPLGNPLDPKVLPDCIGIVDFVLSGLYHEFSTLVKRLEEDEANKIFQIFDALMLAVSNLKQKERGNVLDNPSDLDDLFEMTNIRSQLISLIKRLLGLKNGNAEMGKSAFLVAIDDFDLDTRNVYGMTLDIMSYLNIDGLILLVSMDEEVFEAEVQRGRIKETSDYGEITRSLFAKRTEDSRAYIRDRRLIILERKAERYERQVYTKLIPLSARIVFHSFSLSDQNPTIYSKMAVLADILFGFPTSFYQGAITPKTRFLKELTTWDDIRTRNQVINGLLRIFKSNHKDNIGAPLFNQIGLFLKQNVPATHSPIVSATADLLCDAGSGKDGLNLLNAIERDTFFSSKQVDGKISIIGKRYFDLHPASILIYNNCVDVFLDSAGKNFKPLFEALEIISEGELRHSSGDAEEIMVYGNTKISVENMLEALERGDLSSMYSYASRFINHPSEIKRPIALEIVQKLKDYLIVHSGYSLPAGDAIRNAIETIEASYKKPWKQAGETSKRREEIREALLKCRRYLR